MSRHEAFLRADWVDAFMPDLELTALANVNMQDGSALVQATADYYLSRAWTVGGLAAFTFGERRSDTAACRKRQPYCAGGRNIGTFLHAQ